MLWCFLSNHSSIFTYLVIIEYIVYQILSVLLKLYSTDVAMLLNRVNKQKIKVNLKNIILFFVSSINREGNPAMVAWR